MGDQGHDPAALPSGKNWYPLYSYRSLRVPQDRSGWVRNISPPPGFETWDCPARSKSLYRLSYPFPRTLAVHHVTESVCADCCCSVRPHIKSVCADCCCSVRPHIKSVCADCCCSVRPHIKSVCADYCCSVRPHIKNPQHLKSLLLLTQRSKTLVRA